MYKNSIAKEEEKTIIYLIIYDQIMIKDRKNLRKYRTKSHKVGLFDLRVKAHCSPE